MTEEKDLQKQTAAIEQEIQQLMQRCDEIGEQFNSGKMDDMIKHGKENAKELNQVHPTE